MADGKIHWTFHMEIGEGNLEEYQAVVDQLSEATKGEDGAEVYEWHFSEAGDRVIAHELYSDEAAALAHLKGEGMRLLGKLVGLGKVTGFYVMSDVKDPELRSTAAKLGATFMTVGGGFHR